MEDLILAQIPSGNHFLYHKEWNIINFSVTVVWQRMSKKPIILAHQKSERNTILWYLRLGTVHFAQYIRGYSSFSNVLGMILLKIWQQKNCSSRVQGTTVLIKESDTQGRPNWNGNIMCHQKRNSRTCTKREEEEFGLKKTEILCQPLTMGFTGASIKIKRTGLIWKYCIYFSYGCD